MRALVFGISGQVGRAVAADLARAGWQVEGVSAGGRSLTPELLALGVRPRPAADHRRAQIGAGYDAVVDPMAFTAADAADLLAAQADVGAYVVISTASVYADAKGRALETAGQTGFPRFPDPILETQATVAAGSGYSAGKVALEQVLADASTPVAILRPGAIHGIGARHPREWYFVKRVLDGRYRVPLVAGGASRFHTTAASGLASLTTLCATTRARGTFNVADATAPTVVQIARAIADAMGHDFTLIPVEVLDDPGPDVGHTPWSAAHPLRLSTQAAQALGWTPPDYAATLPPYIGWMSAQMDWRSAFPTFATYGYDPFDYAAEDAALGPLS